jgi:hypothetical protein
MSDFKTTILKKSDLRKVVSSLSSHQVEVLKDAFLEILNERKLAESKKRKLEQLVVIERRALDQKKRKAIARYVN